MSHMRFMSFENKEGYLRLFKKAAEGASDLVEGTTKLVPMANPGSKAEWAASAMSHFDYKDLRYFQLHERADKVCYGDATDKTRYTTLIMFKCPDRVLFVARNGGNLSSSNYFIADLSSGRVHHRMNTAQVLAILRWFMAKERQRVFDELICRGDRDSCESVLRLGKDVEKNLAAAPVGAVISAFETVRSPAVFRHLCRSMSAAAVPPALCRLGDVLGRIHWSSELYQRQECIEDFYQRKTVEFRQDLLARLP